MNQKTGQTGAKHVLSIGAGSLQGRGIHNFFRNEGWKETRLDIDPRVKPDILASATDLSAHVAEASCDATWSSHVLEHLFQHEVEVALAEMQRVLKPDGFALITCPDLERIAQAITAGNLHKAAYVSPAGEITPHDMLFGHQGSVRNGNLFMRHNTGFTARSLGELLSKAGFEEVRVLRRSVDLWALASRAAIEPELIEGLAAAGLDFAEQPEREVAPKPQRAARSRARR